MRQLRAAASFAPPPPVSRPGIPHRHFGEAPCPPAAPPFLEASPIAPKVRRPPAGRQRPQKQLRRSRQLCAAAAQLRAPAPRPSFGRRARSAAAASPAPRPAAAASCRSPTLSPAAGHERDRARFSPRTPANTGRPKLPPRKSPRPSPPSALMSADRRTWPQRRLARGRLEKSNGCKPATPGPPIAEAGAARITRPASFRSTQLFRGIQLCAAPHFDNRISPEATESPISVNRPPFGDFRFAGKSVDSPLQLRIVHNRRFPALPSKFSKVAAACEPAGCAGLQARRRPKLPDHPPSSAAVRRLRSGCVGTLSPDRRSKWPHLHSSMPIADRHDHGHRLSPRAATGLDILGPWPRRRSARPLLLSPCPGLKAGRARMAFRRSGAKLAAKRSKPCASGARNPRSYPEVSASLRDDAWASVSSIREPAARPDLPVRHVDLGVHRPSVDRSRLGRRA